VVRARPVSVTSVDTFVEGVHFRLQEGWATPTEVGHRALAGALSDLAAMGADPGEAYLALGIPDGLGEQSALELMLGAHELARRTGTVIAGGDVVAAPALSVSVTVVGWADDPSQLVGRDGARAGDLVGVTGSLGAAAVALAAMRGELSRSTPGVRAALATARAPQPRLAEGSALARAGVHAMIDLSDGIAADAEHIAHSSAVALNVRLCALPLHAGVVEAAQALWVPPWQLAATGGEDFELCFCAAPEDRERVESAVSELGTVRVSWIGEVAPGAPGLTLSDERGDAVGLHGFEHPL
jgi:thiamine-monophosphate kinase